MVLYHEDFEPIFELKGIGVIKSDLRRRTGFWCCTTIDLSGPGKGAEGDDR